MRVHTYTPPTKRQNMMWKVTDKPYPRKFKQVKSVGKVMLTTFWDSQGIVYEEYLDHGAIVMAERYFDTLM